MSALLQTSEDWPEFAQALLALPVPVWVYDPVTAGFLDVNELALELYGYSRQDLLTMTLFDVRPADDAEDTKRLLQNAGEQAVFGGPVRHTKADGTLLFVHTLRVPVQHDGRAARAVLLTDVTDRVRAEERLLQSERAHREAQRIAHLGSFTQNLLDGTSFWSDELYDIVGLQTRTPDDIFGRTFTHPEDWDKVRGVLESALRGEGAYHLDHRIVRPDGTVRWVQVDGHVELGESGQPAEWKGTVLDITARKDAEQRLEFLARHDSVTGLPNRVEIQRLVSEAIAATPNATLIFVLVDNVHSIDETLGHAVGDEIVAACAERLRARVGTSAHVSRWERGEFVIVGYGARETAYTAAAAVLEAFSLPFTAADRHLYIVPWIGISHFPSDARSTEQLIRKANTAAYEARRDRVPVRYFAASMERRSAERLALENELRIAVAGGQFLCFLQPICDAHTNAIVSAEALVRWEHPSRGMLAPDNFMAVAEETGLIVPIGRLVIEQVCALSRRWRARKTRLPIALNVSARQLFETGFVGELSAYMRAQGVSRGDLEIELTETSVMEDVDRAIDAIAAVRKLGVGIALDDFGTGHNSFLNLKRLPVDTLKIDRSFVRDAKASPLDAAIVETLVSLGVKANLRIIAEGVETEQQANAMRQMGATALQGFYFGRPMLPEAFERLLCDGHSGGRAAAS